MICKLIKATIHPDLRAEFVNRQRIWNRVMSRQPGFLGTRIATHPEEPNVIYIFIDIDSREDLQRFMSDVHDTLAETTRMHEVYEGLDVKILDIM